MEHHNNLGRLGHCVINGTKHPIPRVYLEWLKKIGDPAYEKIKAYREKNRELKTDRQLYAKKKAIQSKIKLGNRKL